jgi:hypothetical protein
VSVQVGLLAEHVVTFPALKNRTALSQVGDETSRVTFSALKTALSQFDSEVLIDTFPDLAFSQFNHEHSGIQK